MLNEYQLQSHYIQYYSNKSQAQHESYFGEQFILSQLINHSE